MKTLLILTLALVPFSCLLAYQDTYQLKKYELSELILLDTKKVNGIWLSCFQTPNLEILTAKNGQPVGREPGSIIEINKKGVKYSSLIESNLGNWIEVEYFISIAKNNLRFKECDWTKKGMQKIVEIQDPIIFKLATDEDFDWALVKTEKRDGKWEACFKTSNSEFLRKKSGDLVPGGYNKIIKIDKSEVLIDKLITVNQSELILVTLPIPLEEDNFQKNECD